MERSAEERLAQAVEFIKCFKHDVEKGRIIFSNPGTDEDLYEIISDMLKEIEE